MTCASEERPRTAEDYWSLPDGIRAELIDGVLFELPTPGRVHQGIVSGFVLAMGNYAAAHVGAGQVYLAPFAVNLFADESTFVEPDVLVVLDESKLSDRGCEGAPDLVVEVVSPSSRRMDYFTKADLYGRAGVREYWIVDPSARQTSVYSYGSESRLLATYAFDDPVPVGIWDGLSITLSEILARA